MADSPETHDRASGEGLAAVAQALENPQAAPASAEKSQGQAALERLLAVRASLLAIAVAQDKMIVGARGKAANAPAARTQPQLFVARKATAFFPEFDRLVDEIETLLARLDAQGVELAQLF